MSAPGPPLDAEALLAAASATPEIADLLPRSVRELAADVGLPVALRLVAACGGTTVYVPVPRKAGPDHPLVAKIGRPSLSVLAAERGGEQIDVPRCAAARRAVVHRSVVAEAAAGVPAARLGARWGYSRAQIKRILRKQDP